MDLNFVQLIVADWPASVAWYRDCLGLKPILLDEEHSFALYFAGMGRLALKKGKPEPGSTMLAFSVVNLEEELRRLAAHGVIPESECEVSQEGYRKVQLQDPEGQRICLFEWVGEE